MNIRVVTDGRPGNATQAMGLAEALARRLPAQIDEQVVRLKPVFRVLPQRVAALFGRGAFAAGPAFEGTPDLVIGAGRRGNLAAAALRRGGARAVAILDPQMATADFDAVIVPGHDRLRGPNVLTTLGALNRLGGRVLTPPEALPALPAPRLALLIGGPSRSARFDRAALARLLEDLAAFEGWSVLATPSRRTPAWVVAEIRAARPDAWIWDGEGENPYPGMLGAAQAIMVTEDSVNMTSEAAVTGKPVHVSGLGRIDAKFLRFHAALRARGITRPAAEGPGMWSYTPLAETERMAAMLCERLGLAAAFPSAAPLPI
ncbi:nucleoside-diphosphate sugar epimerase [Paroceanicella profunda]|uniref:Nucleoside-diphosphate sugar epimerase n=1 Tax=Paroceanicella profunda TaxID=2579971 RepID=A0A5B8FHB8_9RHOB|nr:mitochondrial fission ELM1 family protein [Paroceanicella profunda]QDL92007.1 nucleoside-diphosphate sugar epimerase [Paroceanicella profunda]